jgi:hypothetical protein
VLLLAVLDFLAGDPDPFFKVPLGIGLWRSQAGYSDHHEHADKEPQADAPVWNQDSPGFGDSRPARFAESCITRNRSAARLAALHDNLPIQ